MVVNEFSYELVCQTLFQFLRATQLEAACCRACLVHCSTLCYGLRHVGSITSITIQRYIIVRNTIYLIQILYLERSFLSAFVSTPHKHFLEYNVTMWWWVLMRTSFLYFCILTLTPSQPDYFLLLVFPLSKTL